MFRFRVIKTPQGFVFREPIVSLNLFDLANRPKERQEIDVARIIKLRKKAKELKELRSKNKKQNPNTKRL